MKQVSEQLNDIISNELSKSQDDKKVQDFDKLISTMKKAGVLKDPTYTLPLVDTIGKTYYSSSKKSGNKNYR